MSATKEWLLEQERKNQPDEYEYYIGNVLDKEVRKDEYQDKRNHLFNRQNNTDCALHTSKLSRQC